MSGRTEPLWRLAAGFAALTAAVLLGALLAGQAEGGLDDTNWVGTLGEWFGALGTLFAVGATILMARQANRESDKRHAVEQAALREELRIAEGRLNGNGAERPRQTFRRLCIEQNTFFSTGRQLGRGTALPVGTSLQTGSTERNSTGSRIRAPPRSMRSNSGSSCIDRNGGSSGDRRLASERCCQGNPCPAAMPTSVEG